MLAALVPALGGCASRSKITVVDAAPAGCERIGEVGRTLCVVGRPGPEILGQLKSEARSRGGNVLHCCTTREMDAEIEDCVRAVDYSAVAYACPVRPQ